MMTKYCLRLLTIITLLPSPKLLGTAQIPDLLIYKGDTVALCSNPLEGFRYMDEDWIKETAQFGWSTACWRGYQATWLLENDSLYLVKIGPCHYYPKYALDSGRLAKLAKFLEDDLIKSLETGSDSIVYNSREFERFLKERLGKWTSEKNRRRILRICEYGEEPKANLKKIFPNRFDGKGVFADWFSGRLIVPRGELLEYVHMGYMSTYEYERVIDLENGTVTFNHEYKNETVEIKRGYGLLNATGYSMYLPKNLLDGEDFLQVLNDNVHLSNRFKDLDLKVLSRFSDQRLNNKEQEAQAEANLNELALQFPDFEFEVALRDRSRWGQLAWRNGYNPDTKQYIRLVTMVNFHGQLLISFRSGQKESKFLEAAEYLISGTRLMEFGS